MLTEPASRKRRYSDGDVALPPAQRPRTDAGPLPPAAQGAPETHEPAPVVAEARPGAHLPRAAIAHAGGYVAETWRQIFYPDGIDRLPSCLPALMAHSGVPMDLLGQLVLGEPLHYAPHDSESVPHTGARSVNQRMEVLSVLGENRLSRGLDDFMRDLQDPIVQPAFRAFIHAVIVRLAIDPNGVVIPRVDSELFHVVLAIVVRHAGYAFLSSEDGDARSAHGRADRLIARLQALQLAHAAPGLSNIAHSVEIAESMLQVQAEIALCAEAFRGVSQPMCGFMDAAPDTPETIFARYIVDGQAQLFHSSDDALAALFWQSNADLDEISDKLSAEPAEQASRTIRALRTDAASAARFRDPTLLSRLESVLRGGIDIRGPFQALQDAIDPRPSTRAISASSSDEASGSDAERHSRSSGTSGESEYLCGIPSEDWGDDARLVIKPLMKQVIEKLVHQIVLNVVASRGTLEPATEIEAEAFAHQFVDAFLAAELCSSDVEVIASVTALGVFLDLDGHRSHRRERAAFLVRLTTLHHSQRNGIDVSNDLATMATSVCDSNFWEKLHKEKVTAKIRERYPEYL